MSWTRLTEREECTRVAMETVATEVAILVRHPIGREQAGTVSLEKLGPN